MIMNARKMLIGVSMVLNENAMGMWFEPMAFCSADNYSSVYENVW